MVWIQVGPSDSWSPACGLPFGCLPWTNQVCVTNSILQGIAGAAGFR